jgi:2-methylcitrate dehydratase
MDRRDFLVGTGALAMIDAIGAAAIAQTPAAEPRAEKTSVEEQLANYAAALKYDDLPREVVDTCKRLLIDTLACGYGAIGSPPARIAEETFRKSFGGRDSASVLGNPKLTSTEGAVLINGVLIRYLDWNDTYVGKEPCHPSENIPAALACSEEAGRSGRELIEAIVLGYEAQLALCDAFSYGERGFFSVSSSGFVVPLIAGKLWRMTPAQMTAAMGISGVRQLTLLSINRGPISMMKALPYAQSAMDAIFAARLAADGFTGASNSIEWFTSNVKPSETNVRVELGPQKFRITKVGIKRFPLQFELQTIAEAGVNLSPSVRGRIGDIREIVVETYPTTKERTADPSRYNPATRETADHSLPICLAMALIDGDVTHEQFEKDRWRAAEILALAQKVKVTISDKLIASAPRGSGAIVKIAFTDGKAAETIVEIADGDARRPLSRAALEHKFNELAVPALGAAGAAKVTQLVDRLEELPDVHVLTQALRGG